MHNLGAFAICALWGLIYAIVVAAILEALIFLFTRAAQATYPPPLRPSGSMLIDLVRLIPLIYFVIVLIRCVMLHGFLP